MLVVNKGSLFGGTLRHPVLDWAEPRYVAMGTGDRGLFVLFVRRGGRLDVTPRGTPRPPSGKMKTVVEAPDRLEGQHQLRHRGEHGQVQHHERLVTAQRGSREDRLEPVHEDRGER